MTTSNVSQLQSQMLAEGQISEASIFSEEIVKKEVERLPDSPLDLISTSHGHFIAFGKYSLTELYATKEEALEVGFERNYNLIVALVSAICREEFAYLMDALKTAQDNAETLK